MRLTRKRLEILKAVSDQEAIWVNSSWNAWPKGEHPKWALEQFAVADELIRLALIGIEHDDRAKSQFKQEG
jgi:hypothetical protein